MKIAFTSPNGKTLAGHAGKCPGYVIMTLEKGNVTETSRVKLEKDQVFSQFSGALSEQIDHPLLGIDKFVTLGCGEGLKNRLTSEGIEVIVTQEKTPEAFIKSYLS